MTSNQQANSDSLLGPARENGKSDKVAVPRRSKGSFPQQESVVGLGDDSHYQTPARKRRKGSNETDESYDLLEHDFVEELREGWDDLGDKSPGAKDDKDEQSRSSRALLAREGFLITTFGLAREFLLRLMGGPAPGSPRFGSSSF